MTSRQLTGDARVVAGSAGLAGVGAASGASLPPACRGCTAWILHHGTHDGSAPPSQTCLTDPRRRREAHERTPTIPLRSTMAPALR